ncbi:hypothetical protein [Oceanobacillus alkalisoli]|nr:hypothetical protein [Oceanobacillus alkalisoli]MCG5103413.1 hypothetical protein [Oceanobacillus alkalisoli]
MYVAATSGCASTGVAKTIVYLPRKGASAFEFWAFVTLLCIITYTGMTKE